MKKENDIWTLSAKYLSGEMFADEKHTFLALVNKDQNLKLEFEKIQLTWNTMSEKKPAETTDSWNSLYHRLEKDGLLEQEEKKIIPLKYILSRAAAVIIGIVVFGFAQHYFSSNTVFSFSKITSLKAVENVSSYTLPDGSRVFLNKGSHLSYAKDFVKNRKIKLKGEGYFEVMSDPKNPFIIETKKAFVRVLGTSFNVKETNESTEILVESGKVQLIKNLDSDGIFLTKGEFGKSSGEVELKENNTDANYLSWKTRKFQFSDQNLKQVLDVLAKSYHIKIETTDSSINNFKLSSTYNGQSIDSILETICTAFDLKCDRNDTNYMLSLNDS